jgi:DNA-binding CsgD family transcriptional regulator
MLEATRRVRRLAVSGLDSTALRTAVVAEIRRVVPVDAAFFPTADPVTLMYTSAVRIDMPDGVTQEFLENEFGHEDVNKFRDLADAGDPVNSLDRATCGDRHASQRYDAIMRPLGLGDELRGALRTKGTTWGFICLHRADGPLDTSGFTDSEIAFICDVAPDLAEGLRRAALVELAVRTPTDDGPGIVTLAADLSVVGCTPSGQRWLDDLAEADTPYSGPVPTSVRAVASALITMPEGHVVPRLTARTASGQRVVLHASFLAETTSQQIAVVIEPASRLDIDPTISAIYQLTRRESETLALLLRGLPSKSIGTRLNVTTDTVNDHIKSIYAKTGINGRGALMAAVFRDRYLPPGGR